MEHRKRLEKINMFHLKRVRNCGFLKQNLFETMLNLHDYKIAKRKKIRVLKKVRNNKSSGYHIVISTYFQKNLFIINI